MRGWRGTHPLNGKARLKHNAMAYLRMYIKRGKAHRLLCEVCGSSAHAYHADYSKPLEVTWLCDKHKTL